jgi:hypothetical protein
MLDELTSNQQDWRRLQLIVIRSEVARSEKRETAAVMSG